MTELAPKYCSNCTHFILNTKLPKIACKHPVYDGGEMLMNDLVYNRTKGIFLAPSNCPIVTGKRRG